MELRQWWDRLNQLGPKFGYFVNPKKTNLQVKPHLLSEAQLIFQGTGVTISCVGQRYLGSVIGEESDVEDYVREKVEVWKNELLQLIHIGESQPHAAFACFVHGFSSKWVFPSRTVQGTPNPTMRSLFSLPARLGGLGVFNPTKECSRLYQTSEAITYPLVNLIVKQDPLYSSETYFDQIEIKTESTRTYHSAQNFQIEEIKEFLPDDMLKPVEMAGQQGASIWLTALPIKDHGFALYKSAFHDALALRYGWQPGHLPLECVCGLDFTVNHAMNWPCGGLIIQRHNELRDLTGLLLAEVCHDVTTEPVLQPLTGETMQYQTAITTDDARLDIQASGFWGMKSERAFFDVKVFNPLTKS